MRTPLLLIAAILLADVCAAADAPIDAILAGTHEREGLAPTPICDDATFVRRVSLDLLGRVPTVKELNAFAESGDRAGWVQRQLASEEFPRYWSQLWATILVGREVREANREALRSWLEEGFRDNRPLDQMAFDLISAEGVTALDGPVNFLVGNRDDPVTPVSRVFLGVQLDCAQCHDHPYDRWTQTDHAAMRRFFRTIDFREVSGGIEIFDNGADAGEDNLPKFLTGAKPRTSAWRRELAFMTVRCKPFARAMGNRVWQLLFGRGIVDPVDGLSDSHAASVPELHQALADQLRSQRFDLRRLIQTICSSEAYSRRVPPKSEGKDTRQLVNFFAARQMRPLLPEQLIGSYRTILNRPPDAAEKWNEQSVAFLGRSAAGAGATDPLDSQRTSQGLLQELAADAPTPLGDLDWIFLSTLSRRPNDWERDRLAGESPRDVLYALLHCNEFVFSH